MNIYKHLIEIDIVTVLNKKVRKKKTKSVLEINICVKTNNKCDIFCFVFTRGRFWIIIQVVFFYKFFLHGVVFYLVFKLVRAAIGCRLRIVLVTTKPSDEMKAHCPISHRGLPV